MVVRLPRRSKPSTIRSRPALWKPSLRCRRNLESFMRAADTAVLVAYFVTMVVGRRFVCDGVRQRTFHCGLCRARISVWLGGADNLLDDGPGHVDHHVATGAALATGRDYYAS